MTPDQRHFLLRKLHSLSGIVPVGLFLFMHLNFNSYASLGREAFGRVVENLDHLPFKLWVELGFIFLPILAHALYGIYITCTSAPNSLRYPWAKNWLYLFQRVTALVLVVFIPIHIWGTWGTRAKGAAMYDVMVSLLSSPWTLAFYVLGVLAAIFHFANGIWTFCISWGAVVGVRSQRIVAWACVGFGLFLCALGINSLLSFIGWGLSYGLTHG